MNDTAPFPWQLAQWRSLTARLSSDRMPHALLLTGPAGMGKRLFGEALAQALLCESRQEGGGCGACRGCHLLATGSHPDFLRIEPEEEGKEIGISRIRDAAEFQALKAQFGPYKVLLLHPADRLTANAANALLKTLEEPTAGTVLILVTDRGNALLPTIRSRCQSIAFRPELVRPEVEAWLQPRLPDSSSLPLLLTLADGAPFQAIAFAEDDRPARRKQLFDLLEALARGEANPVEAAASWMEESDGVLAAAFAWVADLIRLKIGGDVTGLSNPDMVRRLQPLAERVDLESLYHCLDRAQDSRRLARGSANRQLLLEEFFIGWTQWLNNKNIKAALR